MKSVVININKYNVIFKIGDDEMVYKTDVNKFVKESGLTIENVVFPIEVEGFYIKLSAFSKTFSCGNVIENLFMEIKKNNMDNSLFVIDFDGVEEVTKNFYKIYTKILLETSNKIITINMDTNLSNEFSNFIIENIIDPNNDVEE